MAVREKINSNFLYFFDQGQSYEAYNVFGAHLVKDEDGKNIACEFCLYAPNAEKVHLVGEWNDFIEGCHELFCVDDKGVWYARLEGDFEWQRYKYLIITKDGRRLYKADPYGFYTQVRPSQDSKVYDIDGYKWNDDFWMYTHPKVYDQPMLIYEMHMGSWKRKPDGEFYMFNEIAPMLIKYLKEFGYTHVEVMPVYEHPLDASWGYQGTGYYAITPRYGVPKDFMWFVDKLHQNGIGVVMDWVPGHICRDSQGLYNFDGSWLYDYENEDIRENKEWGTANLDLGKGVTRSFLYSNAMFYMKYFHIDGFRVDAVSNLIYYLGDKNNGVNEGACGFLQGLSNVIFGHDDRVLLMAEDSSDYPNVTKPANMGLGFNFKWDMGWMNDTLKYFKLDPIYRKYHHHQLTFSMVYNYNEQYILPLSHDEVVHMKGSLLNKMPGDYWQQFANYRLLIGYMLTHPGKKLLFMGQELAPYSEWHYEGELDWHLVENYDSHRGAQNYVKEFSKLYNREKALYQLDFDPKGFSYIDADNCNQSIYIYSRFSVEDHIVIVMNCTPNTYHNYRIGVEGDYTYEEIINSDDKRFGGSGQINANPIKAEEYNQNNKPYSILITIPPLGIALFKPVKKVSEPIVEEMPKPKRKPRAKKTIKKD